MIKLIYTTIIYITLLTSISAEEAKSKRPESWAQPIKLDGVSNLYKVSDKLYRSAQPTAEGMKNLKQMGIRTVINLRSFNFDQPEIADTDLAQEHIYMKAWHPEREDLIRFLKIATNPKKAPMLVHCQHGADRTGAMCALYRVVVQGWTKEQAIREMTEGGFNFHEIWKNLPAWIKDLDIESVRKELGIKAPSKPKS